MHITAQTPSNKELVVILENETPIRKAFKDTIQDLEIDIDLMECSSPDEYEQTIKDQAIRSRLRVLIMDLSNTPEETDSRQYKAAEYIKREFNENRIPIFVHSGNLEYYSDLEDQGTVFKIAKAKDSIHTICSSIQLMKESNFLNIFCIGGLLDNTIMGEIHKAFVNQFKHREIEEIIKSIKEVHDNNYAKRTVEVFQRIAIRCVFENLISTKKQEDGEYLEAKLNAIEHYYRRTSDYPFWTGDIFRRKSDGALYVLVTPRCNVAHENFIELMLCRIIGINDQQLKDFIDLKVDNKATGETKGQKKLRKSITDDATLTGERFRFLPPTPQFEGGFVDFKETVTIDPKFEGKCERIITLSDELANDVVRKLASYILRGGISETEFSEAHYYISKLTSTKSE
jgi:hypothetical protein